MAINLEYNAHKNTFVWMDNPLERIYQLWPEIMEATKFNSIPHVIGEMKIQAKTITDIRMDVILKENAEGLVIVENDTIYFMLPVEVTSGVEGLYLKLLSILR
ncbi:MAG TPA: hypothetical protein EYH13_03460 [Thermococcus paralvinellae]|uniref:Uncharacterized protein n=1 Tax=Thermococcus paralvinellae TaxID=582419 RepID=A0A832ZA91_9EURY|nr:hypothetical protein [Thermococcus paralvinellae]